MTKYERIQEKLEVKYPGKWEYYGNWGVWLHEDGHKAWVARYSLGEGAEPSEVRVHVDGQFEGFKV